MFLTLSINLSMKVWLQILLALAQVEKYNINIHYISNDKCNSIIYIYIEYWNRDLYKRNAFIIRYKVKIHVIFLHKCL